VNDDFEFWTLKAGPDGLTRINVRPSGRGRRESWLIATQEAERDILKRWAAFHLEQVGFLPAWVRPWL
jgi:hypothetical protein